MGDLSLNLKKNEIVSFESFLKPFPVKKIMEMIRDFFKENRFHPNQKVNLEEYYNIIPLLHEFSKEEMRFGDKRYIIGGFYDYDNDTLKMWVEVERINSEITIYLGETTFSSYDNDYVDYKLYELLEKTGKFFSYIGESVNDWNQMSINVKPVIKERPPVEKFMDDALMSFLDFTKEEHHYSDYEIREGSYNDFMENYTFMTFITMHFSIPENVWGFGNYALIIEQEHIDNELLVLSAFIRFKGQKAGVKLFEEFYDIYSDYLSAEDVKNTIKRFGDKILTKTAEWNKSL